MKSGIFIDGDNMNPKYYSHVEDISKSEGKNTIIVKKVYGDFSEDNMKQWKKTCLDYGLDAVMAWREKSKNSSDMRMVIDILQILHTNNELDSFILVTGDVDFKELCRYIVSRNKKIIGVSCFENSTSHSLKNICSEFVVLEHLYQLKHPTGSTEYTPIDEITQQIQQILLDAGVQEMDLGLVKRRLLAMDKTFHESNYGHKTFKDLILSLSPKIELLQQDKVCNVSIHQS
jgi:uncharacterized LabA/DUF88 family protein